MTAPLKEYLVDETLFVRAVGRTQNEMIDRLRRFLSFSSRKKHFFRRLFGVRKKGEKRRFDLKITAVSKKRLGTSLLHIARCKRKAKKEPDLQSMYSNRVRRAKWAKKIVGSPLRRTLLQAMWQQELMDLFAYANEKKSMALDAERNDKQHPEEVIPLETCLTALLANKRRLELLSFNTDFRYFSGFRGREDYLRFQHMEDFLRDFES